MLRDERQIALNEAVEASLHAAHVHEHGAELLGEDLLGLRELAAQRRRDAEVLAQHVRQLGDLPMEPDPEYEVATDIVSQIKAALAEDQRGLVIERSNEAEEALAAALRETLRHDLPPATRGDLERILSFAPPLYLTWGGAPVVIRARRMPALRTAWAKPPLRHDCPWRWNNAAIVRFLHCEPAPGALAGLEGRILMLYWAVVFLVVAIIAGLFGFGGIASASAGIAQILFFIFLVLLVISLITYFVRGRRPPPPI